MGGRVVKGDMETLAKTNNIFYYPTLRIKINTVVFAAKHRGV